MDQLVALISQKTGLSPEQSRSAAETVLGFLKDKLPAPLAGHIDTLLASSNTTPAEGQPEAAGGGGFGDIAGTLGGLLGK